MLVAALTIDENRKRPRTGSRGALRVSQIIVVVRRRLLGHVGIEKVRAVHGRERREISGAREKRSTLTRIGQFVRMRQVREERIPFERPLLVQRGKVGVGVREMALQIQEGKHAFRRDPPRMHGNMIDVNGSMRLALARDESIACSSELIICSTRELDGLEISPRICRTLTQSNRTSETTSHPQVILAAASTHVFGENERAAEVGRVDLLAINRRSGKASFPDVEWHPTPEERSSKE